MRHSHSINGGEFGMHAEIEQRLPERQQGQQAE